MKKISLLFVFSLQILCLQAASISVSISGFAFGTIPNTLNVGDVITWTNNDASTHTVTSTSVPNGAASFNGTVANGATFSYTVTGSYTYKCSFHPSMTASFTVGGTTATTSPTLTLNTLYPNPAVDNVHIESLATIASVEIYSESGAFIKTLAFSSATIDVSVGDLKKGAYLMRIVSEDGLVETRRIVKM